MKFFVALAAVAAGVSAASTAAADSTSGSDCAADYIVTTCLGTENAKVNACAPSDWDCLCAAYQAVATCYNNCPNDARAAPAQQQVGVFCQNASLYGTKAQASKTAAAGQTAATTPASNNAASTGATKPEGSATESSAAVKPTGSSAAAAVNANGAVIAGIAGLVAAML
ncbi:Putative Gpi anchored serine-threonine rich protein [[Torrubiella] hemipterigena]|uniref:Putative Gpi anchored serine-threonine rich protein n=1 Tax=[Torrubiella] hemipterigena TaxID=1531966 RepID=A0A0A1T4E7_9HYPO|nr:Putative Gpi anchored serine-threonine rich protein [[Torrubiella] hemipterigena]